MARKVQDNLEVGQEPQLINGGTLTRVEGNNIHNDGALTLNTQWTRLLGTSLVYENNFYDYQDSGGNESNPSLAGLLNRLQNDVSLDVNWRLQPTLVSFVGYKYEQINYIGNEPIAPNFAVPGSPQMSDNRDNRSQYVYVGGQYTPLDNLNLAGQSGCSICRLLQSRCRVSSSDQCSPYAVLSGTYTYLPGSYVQLGFNQSRIATDVTAPTATGKLPRTRASTVYAVLNHQFTPKIIGSLNGQIQYATFNGGSVDGQSQTWYSLGSTWLTSLTRMFRPKSATITTMLPR